MFIYFRLFVQSLFTLFRFYLHFSQISRKCERNRGKRIQFTFIPYDIIIILTFFFIVFNMVLVISIVCASFLIKAYALKVITNVCFAFNKKRIFFPSSLALFITIQLIKFWIMITILYSFCFSVFCFCREFFFTRKCLHVHVSHIEVFVCRAHSTSTFDHKL